MTFWNVLLRLLLMLALVAVIAVPFLAEYLSFRKDRKKKISYKRFRVLVFSVVYAVLATVGLFLLKELLLWLGSHPIVQWLATRVSVPGRLTYLVSVLAVFVANFAVGGLFWLLSRPVRLGMKKKNLLFPKKKDGTFSWTQKAERRIIQFFHSETWFFVSRIVKWFAAALSGAYAILFFLYLLPAMFTASWIPYDAMVMLLGAGYLYPAITLLVLWECYYFLEGIRCLADECPQLLFEQSGELKSTAADLQEIDSTLRQQFEGFFACEVTTSAAQAAEITVQHHEITDYIAQAVENDGRNPQCAKEVYKGCLDQLIESGGNALINGSFFSEFSMYFLRYLSLIVARGDNVVLVCNSDTQIEEVYNYVNEGLTEIASLYCKGFGDEAVRFDDPIWRIVKISGEHDEMDEATVDDNSILITTLNYLCSNHFEGQHSTFIHLIDTIVFVDTPETVNRYSRQMAVLNERLTHITRTNSLMAKNGNRNEGFRVRYMSRPVKYVFFDDSKTSGLDKVLKNMLSVEPASVDAMNYNAQTLLRCYNYEGREDENGRRSYPQYFRSDEEIGAVMNMAILSLMRGAGRVTVFADEAIPYANIEETIAAHRGQLAIAADGDNLRVNKFAYNPDEYGVILAVDAENNLPAALRRYASIVSDKPALVAVFSRPYMLRDYYTANIDELWQSTQMARLPAYEERLFNLQDQQATCRAVAQRILVKANAGGIAEEEIWALCEGVEPFDAPARRRDTNAILCAILELYEFQRNECLDLFKYFEYSSVKDFDENGLFVSQDKVLLRRQGKLFDKITGRDMVVMSTGDSRVVLPVPKCRLTQNFIVDQNVLYNGNIYYIHKIDTQEGCIHARLAVGGKNDEAYQYHQVREYRVDWPAQDAERICPTKHVVLGRELDDVTVNDVYVSAFRADAEVLTAGYYEVDPHTMAINYRRLEYHSINDEGSDALAKQTYRRYGKPKTPVYSTDSVLRDAALVASDKGALVMSLRMTGRFGADADRTAALAATMLEEILHSMFPSVADALVVCAVRHGEATDEDAAVLNYRSKVTVLGREETPDDLELLIIEDSAADLGVISVLLSAGDDILNTLFAPIYDYLNWYAAAEKKSEYLYYGLDHEPSCFDFTALHNLAALVGDDCHDVKFVDMEQFIKYDTCDFCGKRFAAGAELVELDDGRRMCAECAGNLVGNNRKILKAHFERAKIFLESTYGIKLDDDYDVCFESTLKIVNTLKRQQRRASRRGADIPLKSYVDDKQRIHAEYGLPSVNLSELLVRELTHVWQQRHIPDVSEELAEGHIALVGVQYLRFLNQATLAGVRANYFETTANPSGVGYRRLAQELLAHPQFNNNPFRYLLEADGQSSESVIAPPVPRVIEEGEYGAPYAPQGPDRCAPGELTYFYRSRLTGAAAEAYDTLLAAVQVHAPSVQVIGCSFEEVCKIVDAIQYDHPELFYFSTISMRGSEVLPVYGATAEEATALSLRMEPVVAQYLEGITDSMSAYDVALRLHVKMIANVDYDTVALNRETARGGPARDKIDPLRTVCGVFLDGKAVCEGYARAMQYLLQRCGVECAEAAGDLCRENGGAHAWNILKIDGEYYYLDTTWDDSSDTVQSVKKADLGFDYFCITSDELSRTRDTKYCPTAMPACTATKANYYHHNGLVMDGFDAERIKTAAQAAVESGSKVFAFKCASRAVYEDLFRRFCVDGSDCYDMLKAAAKKNRKLRTDTYAYTYNNDLWTITVKFQFK